LLNIFDNMPRIIDKSYLLNSPHLAFILIVGILNNSHSFCIYPSLHFQNQLAMHTNNLYILFIQIDQQPHLIWSAMVLIYKYLLIHLFGLVCKIYRFGRLCHWCDFQVLSLRFQIKLLLGCTSIGLHDEISRPCFSLTLGNSNNLAIQDTHYSIFHKLLF